jgi:hypothetical protein
MHVCGYEKCAICPRRPSPVQVDEIARGYRRTPIVVLELGPSLMDRLYHVLRRVLRVLEIVLAACVGSVIGGLFAVAALNVTSWLFSMR